MSLTKRLALKFVRIQLRMLSFINKRKAAEKAFQLFCTPQFRTKKRLPSIFEQAEKLEFDFNKEIIRGYRSNHPSKKKALILHGFESGVVNFERYVGPLIKKGYEVLAFDAPAHGNSTGKTITVVVYKNLIRLIWEKYGPVDSFLAHSFGGLALSLALEEIQHNTSTKIVLVAPAAETRRAIDNFFQLLRLNDEVRKEFDMLIEEIGNKPPEWYSVSRAAAQIRGQILFLQDKDDHTTPLSDVKAIMDKNYPNFQFIISEGLGHRRIYRDETSISKIIDFL